MSKMYNPGHAYSLNNNGMHAENIKKCNESMEKQHQLSLTQLFLQNLRV